MTADAWAHPELRSAFETSPVFHAVGEIFLYRFRSGADCLGGSTAASAATAELMLTHKAVLCPAVHPVLDRQKSTRLVVAPRLPVCLPVPLFDRPHSDSWTDAARLPATTPVHHAVGGVHRSFTCTPPLFIPVAGQQPHITQAHTCVS